MEGLGERWPVIFPRGDGGVAEQRRDELNAVSVPVCGSVSLAR